MGQALLRLAAENPAFQVSALLARPGDAAIGTDVHLGDPAPDAASAAVRITAEPAAACDVLIDFTRPAGLLHALAWCERERVALVSGTTGLAAEHQQALDQAARTIPVLWSPNTSLGVNQLLRIVEAVAAALPPEAWDVEIVETHHRFKADAPSGTAQALRDRIVAARRAAGWQTTEPAGTGPRRCGSIGVHAVRMGDVVGAHAVHFSSLGETLTLAHEARTRDIFARGALAAARWIAGKSAGRYTMRDVLA